jgi:hypothetical protein
MERANLRYVVSIHVNIMMYTLYTLYANKLKRFSILKNKKKKGTSEMCVSSTIPTHP